MTSMEIKKMVANYMSLLGYYRMKGLIVKDMGKDCLATIGLTMHTSGKKGCKLVNLFVGVWHKSIYELDVNIGGYPRKYIRPSVITHIYALEPDRKFIQWEMGDGLDNYTICQDFIWHIETYANPFFEKYSNFESAAQYILSKKEALTYFYHAFIYYLQGDKDKGIAYIEDELAEYIKLHGDNGSMCEYYRDALRKYKELK